MRLCTALLHFVLQAEKSHDDSKASNVNIAVISVDILLDIPFALRGGTREEEVVGADKDERAATTQQQGKHHQRSTLVPTAVPPGSSTAVPPGSSAFISFNKSEYALECIILRVRVSIIIIKGVLCARFPPREAS